MNLLNKVLGIVAGVLLIDHEVRRKDFQQVPYHRYINFFCLCRDEEPVLDKKMDPGLYISNEDRFLKVYKTNILDNFNSLFFVFILSVSDVP